MYTDRARPDELSTPAAARPGRCSDRARLARLARLAITASGWAGQWCSARPCLGSSTHRMDRHETATVIPLSYPASHHGACSQEQLPWATAQPRRHQALIESCDDPRDNNRWVRLYTCTVGNHILPNQHRSSYVASRSSRKLEHNVIIKPYRCP
jgi:hypothetical protein